MSNLKVLGLELQPLSLFFTQNKDPRLRITNELESDQTKFFTGFTVLGILGNHTAYQK